MTRILLPSSPRYISSIIDYYPDLLTPATASHVPLNLAKMQRQTPSPSHGLLVCLFVFHAGPQRREIQTELFFVASFQNFKFSAFLGQICNSVV